jgi:hypothetical protein
MNHATFKKRREKAVFGKNPMPVSLPFRPGKIPAPILPYERHLVVMDPWVEEEHRPAPVIMALP